MVAIMYYANGLRFSGIICENEEIAQKYLKTNSNCCKIVPVDYIDEERIQFGSKSQMFF